VDDRQFDAVSKRLGAAQLTRGRMLRGVLGAAAAAMTGAVLASTEADAKRKKRKKGNARKADRVAVESPPLLPPGKQHCRPVGHPCEGNQVCCAGSCERTGPGNAKRCVDSPACGAKNQACCENDVCLEGLTCQNGACVPDNPTCGAQGQPCCDGGEPCQGGLSCQGGTCQPACGEAGQVCCAEETCGAGLECQGGYCVPPCGGETEICCGNDACGPKLTCTGNPGTCEPCGGDGQICCAGTACDAPFQCVNGTCVSFQPGGICATDADCPAGSVCIDGTCVSFGLTCKSGETAMQCCVRSVKKGCKRKQQSKHARKNCLKKGKRRCNALLSGV
jgi:hypothetical protein